MSKKKVKKVFSQSRKSQITIFIVLGVLILLAVMIVSFLPKSQLKNAEVRKITATTLDSTVIKGQVNDCLKQVAERGARIVASQGGYVNPKGDTKYGESGDGLPSKVHYFFGGTTLPYLFFDKKSRIPKLEDIQTKLASYVVLEMQNCLDFTQYKKQNYRILQPNIARLTIADVQKGINVDYSGTVVKANVVFGDETTIIDFQYPIVFERQGTKIEVKDFGASLLLRFKTLYSFAEKLLKQDLTQEYQLQKHCSIYSTKDKLVNVYVRTNQYDYDYVVQIVDAKPLLSKGALPLKFQFATRNAKIVGDCVG